MDSANSGSLQSSSGADDEYDSRSADPFMISHAPPFFDPLSTYFPDPAPPRSALPPFPPVIATQAPPPAQSQSNAAARVSKKRSRASRRAPTTVLTTDTTNFRAMVQEFTGIPSGPFNNSFSVPRTRLDLFSPKSPPYLRRPLPQKLHPPPPLLYAAPISPNLNLFNINQIQNPILNSLLQSNQNLKFSLSNSPKLGEQFGSNALAGLPDLIQSDQMNKDQNDVAQKGVESWICSSE